MHKALQNLGFSITAAALTLAATTVSAQSLKIGVFDPQRVSEESTIGKQVQAELTSFRDRKQAEISGKEQEIQEMQRQLEQQELSLSPDRRSEMEKDIQRQLLELQSAREQAGRQLQLEVNEAQSEFEEKLILTVRQFGKEEGFSVVLDTGLVAYSDVTLDVTARLVERLNTMFAPDPTE